MVFKMLITTSSTTAAKTVQVALEGVDVGTKGHGTRESK